MRRAARRSASWVRSTSDRRTATIAPGSNAAPPSAESETIANPIPEVTTCSICAIPPIPARGWTPRRRGIVTAGERPPRGCLHHLAVCGRVFRTADRVELAAPFVDPRRALPAVPAAHPRLFRRCRDAQDRQRAAAGRARHAVQVDAPRVLAGASQDREHRQPDQTCYAEQNDDRRNMHLGAPRWVAPPSSATHQSTTERPERAP